MNVRVLTSEDGGKTFVQLDERDKHSDNHAIVFKKNDPDYIDMLYRQKFNYVTENEIIIKLK